jgi:hypothetical protein
MVHFEMKGILGWLLKVNTIHLLMIWMIETTKREWFILLMMGMIGWLPKVNMLSKFNET